MVIRVFSMPDDIELTDLHETFQALMDWTLDLGYSFRIHGHEFTSVRRKTRPQPLRAVQLHSHEKFRSIADTLHLWEWEIRVLDVDAGTPEDRQPRCESVKRSGSPRNSWILWARLRVDPDRVTRTPCRPTRRGGRSGWVGGCFDISGRHPPPTLLRSPMWPQRPRSICRALSDTFRGQPAWARSRRRSKPNSSAADGRSMGTTSRSLGTATACWRAMRRSWDTSRIG